MNKDVIAVLFLSRCEAQSGPTCRGVFVHSRRIPSRIKNQFSCLDILCLRTLILSVYKSL